MKMNKILKIFTVSVVTLSLIVMGSVGVFGVSDEVLNPDDFINGNIGTAVLNTKRGNNYTNHILPHVSTTTDNFQLTDYWQQIQARTLRNDVTTKYVDGTNTTYSNALVSYICYNRYTLERGKQVEQRYVFADTTYKGQPEFDHVYSILMPYVIVSANNYNLDNNALDQYYISLKYNYCEQATRVTYRYNIVGTKRIIEGDKTTVKTEILKTVTGEQENTSRIGEIKYNDVHYLDEVKTVNKGDYESIILTDLVFQIHIMGRASGQDLNYYYVRFFNRYQPTGGLRPYLEQNSFVVQNESVNVNDFNLLSWVTDFINGVFNVEIFEGVTFGLVFWLILGIGVLVFLLKVFLGG